MLEVNFKTQCTQKTYISFKIYDYDDYLARPPQKKQTKDYIKKLPLTSYFKKATTKGDKT